MRGKMRNRNINWFGLIEARYARVYCTCVCQKVRKITDVSK